MAAALRARLAHRLVKAARALLPPPVYQGGGGWLSVVREPYTGAWQQNQPLTVPDVLAYGPVFACTSLIAQSIAKLALRLMRQDAGGIWTETTNPAYSPLLRKPNRYQTRVKFLESWFLSKLIWGNTYVLKVRDDRGVVIGAHVLNPARVRPLVSPDGAIYYEMDTDPLAELIVSNVIPASEVMHDPMVCLYHPLCGVSPIYACGLAAAQGLAIEKNSTALFSNGGQPPGVILVPGAITKEQAADVQTLWKSRATGDVAILPMGMKYDPLAVNAVDAEVIKQLQWTAEDVARCYHVPPSLIAVGAPSEGTYTPVQQLFYSDALQPLIANFELTFDEGIGILAPVNGTQYGTEIDVDDLLWMDHEMRAKVAGEAVQHGVVSPNEARQDYFGKPPVAGGETPYLQEQNWPLQLLAARELPTRQPTAPAPITPTPPPPAAKELEPAALEAALAAALGLAA